ncbi:MAG: hypothetical protein HY887_05920 [Deltaproteobacteria bacterium]|nr:hypothetical protein [Deltaproteobacteria bacterium]
MGRIQIPLSPKGRGQERKKSKPPLPLGERAGVRGLFGRGKADGNFSKKMV